MVFFFIISTIIPRTDDGRSPAITGNYARVIMAQRYNIIHVFSTNGDNNTTRVEITTITRVRLAWIHSQRTHVVVVFNYYPREPASAAE